MLQLCDERVDSDCKGENKEEILFYVSLNVNFRHAASSSQTPGHAGTLSGSGGGQPGHTEGLHTQPLLSNCLSNALT